MTDRLKSIPHKNGVTRVVNGYTYYTESKYEGRRGRHPRGCTCATHADKARQVFDRLEVRRLEKLQAERVTDLVADLQRFAPEAEVIPVTPQMITKAAPRKSMPKSEGYYKQRIRQYQQDEADLTKQVHDLMEGKDAQVEALSKQRESLAELRERVAKLSKLIDRREDENHVEMSKANQEIKALRTLVKLYI